MLQYSISEKFLDEMESPIIELVVLLKNRIGKCPIILREPLEKKRESSMNVNIVRRLK